MPLISAALEAGNPRNTRGLGHGFRNRSGYCKVDNFGASVVFQHFGGLGSTKSKKTKSLGNGHRKKSGALEMASAKRAGPPAKERELQNRPFWCFGGVSLISAVLEAGNQSRKMKEFRF